MQRLAEPEDEFAAFETGTSHTNSSPANAPSVSEQDPIVPGLRLSDSVSRRVMANFPGTRQEFGAAYQGFSQAVQDKEGSRFRLDAILAAHPEGMHRHALRKALAAATGKDERRAGYDMAVVLSAKDSNTGERHRSCREGFWIRRENQHVELVIDD